MELKPLIAPNDRLKKYLQQASKPVIVDLIGMGRVRAMGYYFQESWNILHNCQEMIYEYELDADPELNNLMIEFENLLRSSQCEKFQRGYNALLRESQVQKDIGEYILARGSVEKAIEMVLDDTVCHINDQEAWYARAQLEYPAEFTRRKQLALDLLPSDAEGFVREYLALGEYYHSRGLEDEGVIFEPMHKIVMEQDEKEFLEEMFSYYLLQKDRDQVIAVMHRLWDLHQTAPSAAAQERLGGWLAGLDMEGSCDEPLRCLNREVPVNSAFRKLRYQYKLTWVKESGSKFKYLSLFLRNKPSKN
jgi:hypothetical protein